MQASAQERDTDLCLERSLSGWCGGWTGEGETGAGALQLWLSQGRGRGGGVRPNGCLGESSMRGAGQQGEASPPGYRGSGRLLPLYFPKGLAQADQMPG